MKNKLLEALKTKFVGVDDAILEGVAGKLATTTTNESDIATAVEGVTFASLLQSYGDSRANQASLSAVKNYEAKHHLKDGKLIEVDPQPAPTPKPNEGEGNEMPAWAKALMEANEKQMQTMQAQLQAMQTEKVTASRKSQLDALLKDAPSQVKAKVTKDFARMNFESDEAFATYLEETKADVTELSNAIIASKGIVTAPKGGGFGKVDDKGVNSLVAERNASIAKTQESAPVKIKGL